MVDLDQIAVAAVVPTLPKDGALGGRIDRRAISTGQIDSGVHRRPGVERVGADSEAAGEADVGPDRLVGRDRDHAVLQLIELLPAVEQRLEGGVSGAFARAALATASGLGRIEAELLQRRRIDVLALEGGGERELALLDRLHPALGLGG